MKLDQKVRINSEQQEVHFMDLMRFLFTYRRFIICFSLLIPVCVLAWALIFQIAQFRSTAILQVSNQDNLEAATFPVSGFGNFAEEKEVNNKMFALESLFQSKRFRSILFKEIYNHSEIFDREENLVASKKIVRNFLHLKLRGSKSPDQDLSEMLLITREKENDALEISALTWSSQASQALATLAAELLVELNFDNKIFQLRAVKNFLENQADNTRHQLDALESQMTDLQINEKSVSLVDASITMDKEHLEMISRQRNLENQYKANEKLLSDFKKDRLEYLDHIKGGETSYLFLMQLQRKIELYRYQMQVNDGKRDVASNEDPRQQLNSLIQDFNHEMKKDQDKISSMSPLEYLQVIEKNLNDLKIKQKTLHSEIEVGLATLKNQNQDFEKVPLRMQKLAELKRNIEITQKLYGELQTKLQETKVREAGQKNDLLLILAPEIAKKAEGLRLYARMIIGLLLGFFISFSLLIAWYFFVPTLRGKLDLNQYGLDCLGEIPKYRRNSLSLMGDLHPLVLHASPDGIEANAFKNLRFRFVRRLEKMSEHNCRVATFFSANNGEGKSFTVANLALALASVGQKVLLLDLDHVNPNLDKYFSNFEKVEVVPEDKNVLPSPFQHFKFGRDIELIRSLQTEHSFSDTLESAYFQNLVRELRAKHDFILIDTPAIKGNFEAIAASSYSNLMVLVANHRSTLREDVLRAAENMREVYEGTVCTVLNCAYDEVA